jgi:predicted secreted protein
MSWFTGTVLFVLIWWVALFIVLPIGTSPVAEPDQATGWRGAPERARMGRKVLLTTVLAAVLWLAAYGLIASDLISFRHGIFYLPDR